MNPDTSNRLDRWTSRSVLCCSLAALGIGVLGSVPSGADENRGGTITGEVTTKNPKQRGGVVVSLEKVPGTFRPAAKPVDMDQKGMKFVPHVLAVLKGTTVKFNNSDNVRHNVMSPDGDEGSLGTWGQGESKAFTFKASGVFRQLCNVHPEMGAVVVVLDNPYFAVTGDDGRFHIDNVPAGTFTLKTWGEKGAETKKEVTVAAGGTATVKIDR